MNNVVEIENARQERAVTDEPGLENGYIKIVNALAEGMAQSSLTSRQFRVVWAVIRKTYGFNKPKDRIAASQIAEITGMRRQRCSEALCDLERMGVIIREGGSFGAIKINTKIDQWSIHSNEHETPQTEPKSNSKDDPKMGSVTLPDQNGVSDPKMGSNYDPKMGSHKIQNTRFNTPTEYSSSPSDNDWPGQAGESKPKKPACPYEQIRDLYHEILPELPQCKILNDTRKSQIKARWNSVAGKTPCDSLDFWRRYFSYIRKSAFLMGQTDPTPGRKVFRANLEWLTKSANFAKVIEGQYHEGGEQ